MKMENVFWFNCLGDSFLWVQLKSKLARIGSENGLTLNRHRVFILTNDGPVYRRIYSPGLKLIFL